MGKLAIIDGDSLCYLGSKTDTLQQIIEKVDNKIHEILVETKADYYVLLISKGKYFRHTISKSIDTPEGSYKSNRTYTTQPWVKTIKEYLIVKYKAVWYPNLEADDICAWLMNKKEFDVSNQPELWGTIHKILVAKDKDLLYSIPGNHLNFSKKIGPDEWGMEWVNTSEEDAYTNFWVSMIKGDASDGIKGLPGKAEGFIKKQYGDISVLNDSMVYYQYCQHYGISQGIYEFQKNYRLLHMLSTDEDMLREVGYIPQLPNFQQVSFKTTAEKLDDDLTF
jgi:hypothetical protein